MCTGGPCICHSTFGDGPLCRHYGSCILLAGVACDCPTTYLPTRECFLSRVFTVENCIEVHQPRAPPGNGLKCSAPLSEEAQASVRRHLPPLVPKPLVAAEGTWPNPVNSRHHGPWSSAPAAILCRGPLPSLPPPGLTGPPSRLCSSFPARVTLSDGGR